MPLELTLVDEVKGVEMEGAGVMVVTGYSQSVLGEGHERRSRGQREEEG